MAARAAAMVLLLVVMAGPAQAQLCQLSQAFCAPAASGESWWSTLLKASVVLAALGFVGKWLFGEFSGHLKARRDFQSKTAEQVSELAREHYWAVANAAGTLALSLREYLRAVEIHLYVDWADRASLREEIRSIAGKTAERTLMNLIRVLWQFQQFQFNGSQTYLLPHHGSGRQLRRLYNRFRSSLRDEDPSDLMTELLLCVEAYGYRNKEGAIDIASPQFDRLEWLGKPSGPDPSPAAPDGGWQARRDNWERLFGRYRSWLADRLPEVVVATESIETFARLFQHELAVLYGDWYKDRREDDDIALPAGVVARREWPGVLAPSDIVTLARAREYSEFFYSLAVAGAMTPSARSGGGGGPGTVQAGDTGPSAPPPGSSPPKLPGVGEALNNPPFVR